MRFAVAKSKLSPGVDAPGVRWAQWDPKLGEPAYDWREKPHSAGNTRGIRCSYRAGDGDALLERHNSDAHLVPYYLVDPDGAVLARQPRIKKGGLSWVLSLGYAVEVDTLFADIDNPGHSDWTARGLDDFQRKLESIEVLQTCGHYTTGHGARLFQELDEPAPAADAERYLHAWLSELEAAGIGVDWGCRDWTRHFRLPFVHRNGMPTTPALISVATTPRTIRPGPVAVKSLPKGRGSVRRVVGRCAVAIPETWIERAVRLGTALAPLKEGSCHELSLCLAGALLERGVSAESVPAVVVSAANAAGWQGRTADHYWRNSEDTVMKWATGARVRTDVPAALVPVLDDVCGALPAAEQPSLEAEQEKLYLAIKSPGDGLTVVRVACGGGKTRQARLVAAERAAAGLRTTISVPTNELAIQIVEDLRAAGVATCRYFGPTSLADDRACRFRGAAVAIAAGQQSVRWELCMGRKKDPCPYLDGCEATLGFEGAEDALVVVGTHALLGELEKVTGKKGLLIVDEPPPVIEDLTVAAVDLALAKAQLGKFEEPTKLAPALALAEAYLAQGELDVPVNLAEVDLDCPGLGRLLEVAGRETVAEAIAAAVKRGARAPAVVRWQIAVCREAADDRAAQLGKASATLALLYRALTDDSVRVTAFEDWKTGERRLSVAAVDPRLKDALRRDGRVIAMAADAHLHFAGYRDVVCYDPTYVEVGARDGCAVRRVLLERNFGRKPNPKADDATAIRRALDLAVGGEDSKGIVAPRDHEKDHEAGTTAKSTLRIAVVTFKDREAEVGAVVRAWAADRGVEVDMGHYGALRGLDRWKGFDALVTVGDPVPNLSAIARASWRLEDREEQAHGQQDVLARARDLARAELEQAHGRLRVVHRASPCVMVHLGRLVPYGWPPGFEEAKLVERQPVADVQALVQAVGGIRAAARVVGVDPKTVRRWLERECVPPAKAVASLRNAAQGGRSKTRRDRRQVE